MSEQNETVEDQTDGTEVPADEEAQDDAPQWSEEAARVARMMGWRPEAEFKPKRETDKWLPPEQFVSEFATRMRNTNRTNRDLKSKIDRLAPLVEQMQAKMTGAERADVKRQIREAAEAGDYDRVDELTERMAAPGAAEPGEHPALASFKERNDWYGVDDEATDYVAFLDNKYAQESGGVKDAEAHMRKVEAGVKRRYPELFGDKKDDAPATRRAAPHVDRGGRAERPTGGKVTAASLTPTQRRAADAMNVSHKDYAEQLNVMKEASA